MTRVARYKIGYLVILAAILGAIFFLYRMLGIGVLVVSMLLFLIPGRVQGAYYRDFFKGRHLLAKGEAADALRHFERFLQSLRTEPWRKRLLWLAWSVYTTDAEAMTLNNVGVAHLWRGNYAESEDALREALRVDPLYPLPHLQLAIIALIRDDRDLAERELAEAARLGYTGGRIDLLIKQAQSVLARIQGRG